MKIFKHIFFISLLLFVNKNITAQNILLNIITQNSGEVSVNKIVYLEVNISNTNASKTLPAYKLKTQINFPASLISIPDTGHILPKGWKIITSKIGVLIITNGIDVLAEKSNKKLLIAMQGKEIGGAAIISGTITFSNGEAPGNIAGAATFGDNIADNNSTTSIKVVK